MEVWGVLNLSPDSFLPSSRVHIENIVERAEEFLEKGAKKLDIGAESTRPFSSPLTPEEELRRLEPALEKLLKKIPHSYISVDTYKPLVAKKVLSMGISTINDISGGRNPQMLSTVASYQASFVIMHMQTFPFIMQINPVYEDIVEEVLSYLRTYTEKAIEAGIPKEKIIWDYGIGFGKTTQENIELLKNTSIFLKDGFPLMVGVSRKSFIGRLLGIPDPEKRKIPTLALHAYLMEKGVSILRVHDVEETVQIQRMLAWLL